MKLTILNLSRETTEAELSSLFATYGSVTACSLVLDKATGMSKGFGFVEMAEPQAQLAIAALNGTKLKKNRIRVKAVEK